MSVRKLEINISKANLLSLGLLVVKLHPDIQAFKIDDYRCLKIYELCEEKGLPILMHTGDNRYDYSNPNRNKQVTRKHLCSPILQLFLMQFQYILL